MASRSEKLPNTEFQYFRNLQNNDDIDCFIRNLNNVYETITGAKLPQLTNCVLKSFIIKYQTAYHCLTNDKLRSEFRDAFKHHKAVLTDVVEHVLSECIDKGSNLINYKEQGGFITVTVAGLIPESFPVRPRSFKLLYQYTRLMLTDGLSSEEIIGRCRIITSVLNLYTDFRLTDEESDKQLEQDILKISGEPTLCNPTDFINATGSNKQYILLLKETLGMIDSYLTQDTPLRQIPEWARDMIYSIRRCDRTKLSFDGVNIKYSSASSGSRVYRGRQGKSIPGCLASIYEENAYSDLACIQEFDQITKFNYSYRDNEFDYKAKTVSKERNSVAIEQKKPKMRLIHTLSNSSHDRLTLFEEIDKSILNNLPSDCLKDQHKGPVFIRDSMKYPELSLYSLDLTDATNTMLLCFQRECKYIILKYLYEDPDIADILCQAWETLMKQQTSFRFNNGRRVKYTMTSGQPMGYTDSFMSFSIAHHIAVLTVNRLTVNEPGRQFYRILGDDLILCCEDPEFKIPELYKSIMQACNVECNTSKGYLYNPKVGSFDKPIAEFAKYLIMEGIEVTPIPIKLLCSSNYNEYITLLSWVSQHSNNQIKGKTLLTFIHETIGLKPIDQLNLVRLYFKTSKLLNPFVYYSKQEDYEFDIFDSIYLLNEVKDSMALAYLNLYYRDMSVTNKEFTLRLHGLNAIRDDLFSLYEKGKLRQNKLGKLLEYLENIQLVTNYSIGMLFGDIDDIINISEEDKELYLIPLVPFLMEFDPSGDKLCHIIDLLDGKEQLSNDTLLNKEICETCLQILHIKDKTMDRSWSSLVKGSYLNDPLDFICKMNLNMLGDSKDSISGIEVIDYLYNKVTQLIESINSDDIIDLAFNQKYSTFDIFDSTDYGDISDEELELQNWFNSVMGL